MIILSQLLEIISLFSCYNHKSGVYQTQKSTSIALSLLEYFSTCNMRTVNMQTVNMEKKKLLLRE